MKKFILIKLFIFFNILIANEQFSPSFDCSNVKKETVESHICDNENLSLLDNTLAELYKQAYELNLNNNLKQSQKKWLKKRDNCKTISCIQKSYLERVDYLGNLLVKEDEFYDYALFYKEKPFFKNKNHLEFIKGFNDSFESYLDYVKRYNYVQETEFKEIFKSISQYDLKECNVKWLTKAGTINVGYGAICTAKKEEKEVKVFACYNMASVFEIEKPIIANEFELIKFLEQNCYGG